MSVTLWTTVWGDYHRFVDGWMEAALKVGADRILIVSDRPLDVDADVIVAQPTGNYPYCSMLNVACQNADGWLWRMDIDDRILPDALTILDGRDCDVVQVGIQTTKGGVHIPIVVPNETFLSGPNKYICGSPFTKDVWERAGGFPDIAHSDWGFWRRCARIGARFESAGRVAYIYRDEPEDSLMGEHALDEFNIAEAMRE